MRGFQDQAGMGSGDGRHREPPGSPLAGGSHAAATLGTVVQHRGPMPPGVWRALPAEAGASGSGRPDVGFPSFSSWSCDLLLRDYPLLVRQSPFVRNKVSRL